MSPKKLGLMVINEDPASEYEESVVFARVTSV
jgi:hypothetical protein